MTVEEIINTPEYRSLLNDYRDMCLWYMDRDFVPKTSSDLIAVLDGIDYNGTMDAYRRVGRIRTWLSQNSNQTC
jgi:hypothetical protein